MHKYNPRELHKHNTAIVIVVVDRARKKKCTQNSVSLIKFNINTTSEDNDDGEKT